MKKVIIIAFFIILQNIFLFSSDNTDDYTALCGYINRVIIYSENILSANNELKKSELEYIRSMDEEKTEFSIQEAFINKETKKALLSESVANEIISSVETFFSLLDSQENLKLQKEKMSIKIEEERIVKLRFDEDVITEKDFLDQKQLTADEKEYTLKAENELIKCNLNFLRKIKINDDKKIFVKITMNKNIDKNYVFDLYIKEVKLVNANYFDLQQKTGLLNMKYNIIKESSFATKKEINDAKCEFELSLFNFSNINNSLEDNARELIHNYEFLIRSVEQKQKQVELSKNNVESEETNFEFGSILKTQLDLAKLNYKIDCQNLFQEMEKLFVSKLKLDAFIGSDILKYISEYFSSSDNN